MLKPQAWCLAHQMIHGPFIWIHQIIEGKLVFPALDRVVYLIWVIRLSCSANKKTAVCVEVIVAFLQVSQYLIVFFSYK